MQLNGNAGSVFATHKSRRPSLPDFSGRLSLLLPKRLLPAFAFRFFFDACRVSRTALPGCKKRLPFVGTSGPRLHLIGVVPARVRAKVKSVCETSDDVPAAVRVSVQRPDAVTGAQGASLDDVVGDSVAGSGHVDPPCRARPGGREAFHE